MSTLFKTILLIFEEIFYFIFPLSEDERLIKDISTQQFLQKLDVRTRDGVVVLASFKDPEVRAALHLVKFHRHAHALTLVSALFETWLQAHVETGAVIIPIPLSAQRERKRGFNQSALIAKHATARLSGYEIDTHTLIRKKHTPPQTSLHRTDRLKNLTGAFAARSQPHTITGTHVILLDDVSTTGATLAAEKATIVPLAPASITCIAIAH